MAQVHARDGEVKELLHRIALGLHLGRRDIGLPVGTDNQVNLGLLQLHVSQVNLATQQGNDVRIDPHFANAG